jgi:hypothetical protein
MAARGLMDLAGLTRLPEPDFVARIQAGQPHLGPLDRGHCHQHQRER